MGTFKTITQMKFFALAASALALVSAQEKVNLKEKQLMKEREENMEYFLGYIEYRVEMLRKLAEVEFIVASHEIGEKIGEKIPELNYQQQRKIKYDAIKRFIEEQENNKDYYSVSNQMFARLLLEF